MFYYLGRKKELARLYPEPEGEVIIEPFAGSGAYSLHGERWKKRVILNDLSERVVRVWKHLQGATEKDIRGLPMPGIGERLSSYQSLSDEERWLIAWHVNPGADQETDVVTAFGKWAPGREYIASNLHRIRHWEIRQGEYRDLPDIEATWFIDPPYHRSGRYYRTNTVDYTELGAWCLTRRGPVCICEQEGADWLPFKPLKEITICGKSTTREVYLEWGFHPVSALDFFDPAP